MGATTQLQYIADHADRALADLPSQFRKPRIRAFLGAVGRGVQVLEDLLFDILTARHIDHAAGHQLEQLGALVGESKGGLYDREYRRFIRARILAGRTRTTDEFIELWRLVAESSDVTERTIPPAYFVLEAVTKSWMRDLVVDRVAAIVESARPGGVAMALVESSEAGLWLDTDGHGLDDGELCRILNGDY